eukprot:5832515-Amphidinium_carterae.1
MLWLEGYAAAHQSQVSSGAFLPATLPTRYHPPSLHLVWCDMHNNQTTSNIKIAIPLEQITEGTDVGSHFVENPSLRYFLL